VKYEEVYIKDYATLPEARVSLTEQEYFRRYNAFRPHLALGCKTLSGAHFPPDEDEGLPKLVLELGRNNHGH
jgi:hypothetical protein